MGVFLLGLHYECQGCQGSISIVDTVDESENQSK